MWGNTRYCTSCFDLKQKEWNIPKIFLLFFFFKMNPVYIPNFFFLAKYPRWHFKKNTNQRKNPSLPTTPWPQQLWPRTPFCWFPSFRMRRSSSRRSYMARAVPRMLTMAPQTAILLASLQTSTSSWPSFSNDIPKPPWPIAENTPKNILTSWVYLQETVLDLIFNMISAKSSSHRSPQKKTVGEVSNKNQHVNGLKHSAHLPKIKHPPKQVSWHAVSKVSPTFILDLQISNAWRKKTKNILSQPVGGFLPPAWKLCSSNWSVVSIGGGVKIKNIWVATTQLTWFPFRRVNIPWFDMLYTMSNSLQGIPNGGVLWLIPFFHTSPALQNLRLPPSCLAQALLTGPGALLQFGTVGFHLRQRHWKPCLMDLHRLDS